MIGFGCPEHGVTPSCWFIARIIFVDRGTQTVDSRYRLLFWILDHLIVAGFTGDHDLLISSPLWPSQGSDLGQDMAGPRPGGA